MTKIAALPGADRPIDALKFITEMVRNENVKGIVLITVIEANGTHEIDKRSFGRVLRSDMAMAALDLQDIYANGAWE